MKAPVLPLRSCHVSGLIPFSIVLYGKKNEKNPSWAGPEAHFCVTGAIFGAEAQNPSGIIYQQQVITWEFYIWLSHIHKSFICPLKDL